MADSSEESCGGVDGRREEEKRRWRGVVREEEEEEKWCFPFVTGPSEPVNEPAVRLDHSFTLCWYVDATYMDQSFTKPNGSPSLCHYLDYWKMPVYPSKKSYLYIYP